MADEKNTQENSVDKRLDDITEVVDALIDKVEDMASKYGELEKSAVKKSKGKFGGKREPVAIKDMKTGNVYHSMAAVNKRFGHEIGIDPYVETMGFYKIEKQLLLDDGSPRFVRASAEEAEKVQAEEQARREAEVAAANARLAEEKDKANQEIKTKKNK